MTRRTKPVLKDIMGVVHLPKPGSASVFPWCAQHLSLNLRSQHYQKKRLRLVKHAEPNEVTTCLRCILIDMTPGLESEHFW